MMAEVAVVIQTPFVITEGRTNELSAGEAARTADK
jgi:hypothetical protein